MIAESRVETGWKRARESRRESRRVSRRGSTRERVELEACPCVANFHINNLHNLSCFNSMHF